MWERQCPVQVYEAKNEGWTWGSFSQIRAKARSVTYWFDIDCLGEIWEKKPKWFFNYGKHFPLLIV